MCAHTRARESAEMLIKVVVDFTLPLGGSKDDSKGRGRSEGGA